MDIKQLTPYSRNYIRYNFDLNKKSAGQRVSTCDFAIGWLTQHEKKELG